MLAACRASSVALFLCASVFACAQLNTPVAFDRLHTLTLGNEQYFFAEHRQQLAATTQHPREETIAWWELRDEHARVIHRREYPVKVERGDFVSTFEAEASVISTKLGKGVLVQGSELPSAPNSGSWVQVFGKQWGQTESALTSFGSPIFVDGEFINIAVDPKRPTPKTSDGTTLIVMNDVLRFRIWTGNLNIIYPVLINWTTGKLEPAWKCSRPTMRRYLDRCAYPIEVDPHREKRITFVRLFPEPDDALTAKHVVLKPESDVEYLEAETPVTWSESQDSIGIGVDNPEDLWLKIRVDGVEGWIHSEEDLEAVGLPQAG